MVKPCLLSRSRCLSDPIGMVEPPKAHLCDRRLIGPRNLEILEIDRQVVAALALAGATRGLFLSIAPIAEYLGWMRRRFQFDGFCCIGDIVQILITLPLYLGAIRPEIAIPIRVESAHASGSP
jgi:hypothetical protein